MITREVVELVVAERKRQERLKADGRFPHTCADWDLTDAEKLAVLAEEFGEVARAVLERSSLANDKTFTSLREELVQVAAVAVAWIEGLDAPDVVCSCGKTNCPWDVTR